MCKTAKNTKWDCNPHVRRDVLIFTFSEYFSTKPQNRLYHCTGKGLLCIFNVGSFLSHEIFVD